MLLVLWPLVCFGGAIALVYLAEQDMKAWREHPDQPWNVQPRLQEEAIAQRIRQYQADRNRQRFIDKCIRPGGCTCKGVPRCVAACPHSIDRRYP